jgi:hypothetical protein
MSFFMRCLNNREWKPGIVSLVGLALILEAFIPGCALHSAKLTDNRKAERLAIEKGKLSELTDPVDITRTQITISEILLDFAASALDEHQLDGMNRRLTQYSAAIQSARDAMVGSGRNPRQSPAGYKDLEVATRTHLGNLNRIRSKVDQNQREVVETARQATDLVHTEMLELLSSQPASKN